MDSVFNLEKSEFHVIETAFLGHIINGIEIKMQPEKVNVIKSWQAPPRRGACKFSSVLQITTGDLFKNYSAKVKPLTELTWDVRTVLMGGTQTRGLR